ncbi:hypothetical protein PHMEG_0009525 [Phytophthora megakarya]|uniref:Uncharacterized protein n=1 Tax=Phytophthora megakarya TaxID=4795 RepID=A0A225WG05_9STRA|nr:hypothetical protein PHMEG_0009525 [Phytophthora megakarya]
MVMRVARGLDVPQGTAGQEVAAIECFIELLTLGNMNENYTPEALPSQNSYSLLTAFSIFLQSKSSARGDPFAIATAVGYMSQIVYLLQERYPSYFSDSNRIAKLRDQMGPPGCTINGLCVLVQETAIKGGGCGYKNLHDAAVLTFTLHTVLSYDRYMFCTEEPTVNINIGGAFFSRDLHQNICSTRSLNLQGRGALGAAYAAWFRNAVCLCPRTFHLRISARASRCSIRLIRGETPGREIRHVRGPSVKRVRGRPNVAKYINDIIIVVTEQQTKASVPLPPELTAGLTSHSLRRGSAANVNVSPQLSIQWISTCGPWRLVSLTKIFAYVGITTREYQSVAKILAGYKESHQPCITSSINTLEEPLPELKYEQLLMLRGRLFNNMCGITDTSLNVDSMTLEAVLAALISTAVTHEQATSGFVTHYLYRFHEAVDNTDAALESILSLENCVRWGRQRWSAWETANYVQLGERCGGDTSVFTAAVTQMLFSIATMQRILHNAS